MKQCGYTEAVFVYRITIMRIKQHIVNGTYKIYVPQKESIIIFHRNTGGGLFM